VRLMMQNTDEPDSPAAQVRVAVAGRQRAITAAMGNLTHVRGYVKERRACVLRFRDKRTA
jgi:hypothetical protein